MTVAAEDVSIYRRRLLPPEEWTRLAGTELEQLAERVAPDRAAVTVIENQAGEIVGCWAALWYLGAEGCWIAPAHRRRGVVAREVIDSMCDVAQRLGTQAVVAGVVDADVERLVTKLGAQPLPGRLFVIPFPGAGK